jgi:hypothetical protein
MLTKIRSKFIFFVLCLFVLVTQGVTSQGMILVAESEAGQMEVLTVQKPGIENKEKLN